MYVNVTIPPPPFLSGVGGGQGLHAAAHRQARRRSPGSTAHTGPGGDHRRDPGAAAHDAPVRVLLRPAQQVRLRRLLGARLGSGAARAALGEDRTSHRGDGKVQSINHSFISMAI